MVRVVPRSTPRLHRRGASMGTVTGVVLRPTIFIALLWCGKARLFHYAKFSFRIGLGCSLTLPIPGCQLELSWSSFSRRFGSGSPECPELWFLSRKGCPPAG